MSSCRRYNVVKVTGRWCRFHRVLLCVILHPDIRAMDVWRWEHSDMLCSADVGLFYTVRMRQYHKQVHLKPTTADRQVLTLTDRWHHHILSVNYRVTQEVDTLSKNTSSCSHQMTLNRLQFHQTRRKPRTGMECVCVCGHRAPLQTCVMMRTPTLTSQCLSHHVDEPLPVRILWGFQLKNKDYATGEQATRNAELPNVQLLRFTRTAQHIFMASRVRSAWQQQLG